PRRCALSCWPSRADDVGRPAGEQAGEPGRADLLLASRPAEMGARTMHQQAPDVAVSALGNMPEQLLAAARVLLRYQTKPGGELARRAELSGIADARHDGGRGNQADPGDLSQSPACCRTRGARSGNRLSAASSISLMSSPARDRPCAAMMPNSTQCPRNALISIVRCR